MKDMRGMQLTEDAILERLQHRGYRMTSSRRVIVQAIVELGEAFAAGMLLQAVQDADPGIGRSTVFRTVDLLATEGVLDEVHLADGTHRYTLGPVEPVHHHHLICSSCGRVVPFEGCTVGDMIDGLAHETGFEISGHQLDVFGVCDVCRRTPSSPATP